jgi:hypothetical protein
MWDKILKGATPRDTCPVGEAHEVRAGHLTLQTAKALAADGSTPPSLLGRGVTT